jgi:hypothetical protein
VGDEEAISKKLEKFSASKTVELYDNYGNPVTKTVLKPVPAGITSKTVISSYIKATGGEKALKAVKELKIVRSAESQYGKINLTTLQKAPDKYLMMVMIGPMLVQKRVFDGTKGKETTMQGKKEITGDELEELKAEAVLNQEMQYEKSGYKLNLKGIEAINGNDAYVLEVENPKGKKSTEWYDLKSGFKVRTSATENTPQGPVIQIADYSDYKDMNGIKYPGVISTTIGPMPIKLTLESVEVNKGIKDTEFSVE